MRLRKGQASYRFPSRTHPRVWELRQVYLWLNKRWVSVAIVPDDALFPFGTQAVGVPDTVCFDGVNLHFNKRPERWITCRVNYLSRISA